MNSTIELTVRNKDIHIRKSDKITTGQQLNKIDKQRHRKQFLWRMVIFGGKLWRILLS